jgi:hypothetical protein
VAVTIGGGVVYVAWFRNEHTLVLRRRDVAGGAWSPAQAVSDRANGFAGASVAAGGDEALIGYSRYDRRRTWPVTERSPDDGVSWGAPRMIDTGDRSVPWAGYVVLERVAAGHYLAHLTACTTAACREWRLHECETTDAGSTWPGGYRPSGTPARFHFPTGLVKLDRVVAAYGRFVNRRGDVLIRAADHDTVSPTHRRRDR